MKGLKPIKIFIVAGEASGDFLGAGLIKALKTLYDGNVQFEGIPGKAMIQEGCESCYPFERLSVMGIWAILKRYRELSRVRKQLIARLIQSPPDLFIGIDAPEFNLGFELALRKAGIKTLHYVSPSVWAWRPKRIFKIKKAVDKMLCLFTFEEKYYHQHDIDVACVGHPLADDIPIDTDIAYYKKQLGFDTTSKILAVLPGSRGSELTHIVPAFIETAYQCWQADPELEICIPVLNEKREQQLNNMLSKLPRKPPVHISIANAREVMAASDLVLLASGTATLEAALLKKNMVVGYRFSKISYMIFKRLLKIKQVSLPNLLAEKVIVPELIQDDCIPEKLTDAVLQRLKNPEHFQETIQMFYKIHHALKRNASSTAAVHVKALLDSQK